MNRLSLIAATLLFLMGRAGRTLARALRGLAAAAAVALLASCAGQAPREAGRLPGEERAWRGTPVVHIRYGALRGFRDGSGTWVWRGVPFALPPVGDLRWRAPQEPEPWEGVKPAGRFSGPCTQRAPLRSGRIIGSEDCLYLNVWRPRTAESGLPVYVWIHGGGNSMGSATMVSEYHGDVLASRGNLVFVSVNYRLGPFGWFNHPALHRGEPEDDSGNFGTLDLIRAMRWIRENIASFGGDPHRVTIAGESAGGINVLSLLISPLAEGLFQRAVVQSGLRVTSSVPEGVASANRALAALLVKDGLAGSPEEADSLASSMTGREIASYLRDKSGREIVSVYDPGPFGMISFPYIFRDGHVIPVQGYDALSTGEYPGKVPVIMGSNQDEIRLFMAWDKRFRGRRELYRLVSGISSDLWKASQVDETARLLAGSAGQPAVYVYQFRWGSPGPQGRSVLPVYWGALLGAAHSFEIPFFLGKRSLDGPLGLFLFTRENRPGRILLSEAMMSYLASFVATGDPNPPGAELPRWRPWTNRTGEPGCMVLDAGLEKPRIGMEALELTEKGVLQRYREAAPAQLFEEAMRYVRERKLPGD